MRDMVMDEGEAGRGEEADRMVDRVRVYRSVWFIASPVESCLFGIRH